MLDSSREAVRARARATGRLVVPDPPPRIPQVHDVMVTASEHGGAVGRALDEERSAR